MGGCQKSHGVRCKSCRNGVPGPANPGGTEVDGNGVSSDNINTFYLITEDNLLYEITVKAENFHLKYQDMTDKVKLHSSDKITKYVYDIKNNEYGDIDYAEVKITYENGQTETIKDLYEVSTLYERYNK